MRTVIYFIVALVTVSFGQDMPLSQVLVEGEDWEVAAEGFEFADGLCTDADGNLYFSDVKGGTAVYRVDLEGKRTEFIKDATGISGLQWGSDGRLYACVGREQRAVVFDKEGKETELAAEVRANDLVVTHGGDLYFTVTPSQEIRRIDSSGVMTVVNTGEVSKPNGITLSRDQGTLAVSNHGGKFVTAFRINEDGSLSAAQDYMEMRTPVADPEIAKGDGMATDVHGRYYVTTAVGLQMFDPTGRMGGVIATPDGGKIYRRKTKTSGALFFAEPKANEAPPK